MKLFGKIYKTVVFDCDGVLLDSNDIKSKAFYESALPYGEGSAEIFLDYHTKNGGVSRFEKFEYLFSKILKRDSYDNELKQSLEVFSDLVKKKLLDCSETHGMKECLNRIPINTKKIVVSGGMQVELREIFSQRGISKYFNKIYGSPDSKSTILERELKSGGIESPAIYIGDSKYDYEAASKANIDFIFMSQYSEFDKWQDFFKNKKIKVIKNLRSL